MDRLPEEASALYSLQLAATDLHYIASIALTNWSPIALAHFPRLRYARERECLRRCFLLISLVVTSTSWTQAWEDIQEFVQNQDPLPSADLHSDSDSPAAI